MTKPDENISWEELREYVREYIKENVHLRDERDSWNELTTVSLVLEGEVISWIDIYD